jgi:hypothetical protein
MSELRFPAEQLPWVDDPKTTPGNRLSLETPKTENEDENFRVLPLTERSVHKFGTGGVYLLKL